MLVHVKSVFVLISQAWNVMSDYFMLGHIMTGYVRFGQVMSCYFKLGQVRSGYYC